MKNKIDKQALREKIQSLSGLSNDDKSQLLALLAEQKRFGLVWEEKEEEAQERMRYEIPVLNEDKSKRIVSDDEEAPNHILIEGDNLHALTALAYTHEGKFDAIYIDPPYNSGATDWQYNNDYVDKDDDYKHSKWLDMMQHRLKIAKRLLNPESSILIVTIDEKEYLHLGCLLEEMFPSARMQMVSSVISPQGNPRKNQFNRIDEYLFFVGIGDAKPELLPLSDEWRRNAEDKRTLGLLWQTLMRTGNHSEREHSPNCFYPILVTPDGKKFVGVGEPIGKGNNRADYVVPEGCVAIWPIRTNGNEGVWNLSGPSLLDIQKKGYVKLGSFTSRGMAIQYLPKGQIEKVESGLFHIDGYNEDGSIISNSEVRRIDPGTQWRISTHDATRFGTKLLKDIFGNKVFSFPKSLYAVADSLNFYVANKPNARILDFFAGSGTTLHATMLLNANDGGHRQCILVTNNENNICEEITYERNKRVINGYENSKGEFVDGLKNNSLYYYKVDFVPRDTSTTGKRKLMESCTDLLCIKNDIYEEKDSLGSLHLKPNVARFFSSKANHMLIIFKIEAIERIVEEIKSMQLNDSIKVYVFSINNYAMDADFDEVSDKVTLCAMPAAIYNTYKMLIPKKSDYVLTETDKEEEA